MHFYAVHHDSDKIQLDLMDVHQMELVLQVMNTPLETLLTVKSKRTQRAPGGTDVDYSLSQSLVYLTCNVCVFVR